MEVISFDSSLNKVHTGKKHIILGNGFSRACRNDIFSYDSLFESANFDSLSGEVGNLFKVLDTTDFEKVMNALEFCEQVLTVYDSGNETLAEKILNDVKGLRGLLVETIAKNHPGHPSDIEDSEYKHCAQFLSHFDKIYSTNYDMLLYWTTMKAIELGLGKWDDGFRDPYFGDSEDYVEEEYVEWANSTHKQNVHYLHGALHLFYSGPSLQKYCWSRTGERLLKQIRDALESKRYPLIVAEGASDQKLEKVQRSNYLGHSYRSLGSISGSLFIFGLSFSENDSHIAEQIRRNTSIKNLFVSMYGGSDSESNKLLVNNVSKIKAGRPKNKPLNVHYFDAQSAKVWG